MIKFSVDLASPATPFPHYWEHCVGSCHAVMGLRSDWRAQLDKCHRQLGFQYVRFHGLLDDDMSVCMREPDPSDASARGRLRYSFFNVDSIFDFLLSIGMKPFIELGFMPSALASGSAACFHYKANITPPADYEEWQNLIQALTSHLVDRYGLAEVQTWFFEVWNEPNLHYFWAGSQDDYFKLYEHAARAIKSVDPSLRIGGPATSVNSWIPEMLAFCRRAHVPLDFVSTHHYPTDDPLWKNSDLSLDEFFQQFPSELGKYERGILRKMTEKARSQAGDLPLFYTEWNTSAILGDPLHDEPYSAAMVAKTIVDNSGLVDGYSFWTFSDLFEEGGQFSAPFHGGYGLQTIHGIPKPTYSLFRMLHDLGGWRIPVEGPSASTVELLAVRGDSNLSMLVYNHNVPGGEINAEAVSIRLKSALPTGPVLIRRIDETHANPKKKWTELGSPEYPSASELVEMEQAAQDEPQVLECETSAVEAVLTFYLHAHAVALISFPLSD